MADLYQHTGSERGTPMGRMIEGFENEDRGLFEARNAEGYAAGFAADGTLNGLNSPDAFAFKDVLLGHYYRELRRQEPGRREMAMDDDFYDGFQWTDEEIAELEERGQVADKLNVVATTVNYMLGSQLTKPLDYSILPKKKEGSKPAERKTELMKYISDVYNSQNVYSRAYADAVRVGLGWIEAGWKGPDQEDPIYERTESWRNVIWDSASSEPDMSDARYLFRTRWVDADETRAVFPERKGVIDASINAGDAWWSGDDSGDDAMDAREDAHMMREMESQGSWRGSSQTWDTERPRVRLFEGWIKRVAQVPVLRGSEWAGEVFDPYSRGHDDAIQSGAATIVTRARQRMMVAIFTERGLLSFQPSPYRHNRFPLTPIWGYRRAKDGMPYGIIRNLRDPQRSLNKHRSKAIFAASVNRFIGEAGSITDEQNLRSEVARPDSVMLYKKGSIPPTIQSGDGMAQTAISMMSMEIDHIQQTSGVTDESMGRTTNATSGKAIGLRQEQGAMAVSLFPVALTNARMLHGQKLLSVIEQYMDEELAFRVTNQNGSTDYTKINDPNDPESDITRTKADFIVSMEDFRATRRQAAVDKLTELAMSLASVEPQAILAILDLIVESMDIPKQGEIVRRIRQITGQEDPDADPNEPTPEKQAAEAAAQAETAQAEAMLKLNMAGAEADAREKIARAMKAEAEAAKVASTLDSGAVQSHLDALKLAIEAARETMGDAGLAQVADMLLAEAEARAQPPASPQEPQMGPMPGAGPQMPPEDPAAMGAMPAAPQPAMMEPMQ